MGAKTPEELHRHSVEQQPKEDFPDGDTAETEDLEDDDDVYFIVGDRPVEEFSDDEIPEWGFVNLEHMDHILFESDEEMEDAWVNDHSPKIQDEEDFDVDFQEDPDMDIDEGDFDDDGLSIDDDGF